MSPTGGDEFQLLNIRPISRYEHTDGMDAAAWSGAKGSPLRLWHLKFTRSHLCLKNWPQKAEINHRKIRAQSLSTALKLFVSILMPSFATICRPK
jgi:hypothetical protein